MDPVRQFYEEIYLRHPSAAEQRGGASDIWRSLAPFRQQNWQLDLPSDYYESLMPDPFIAGPRPGYSPTATESNLPNLAVTVCFKRRLSKKTMLLYVDMVGNWLTSIKRQGIFGEGPIAPVTPAEVVFQNPRAQFRIDAQHSGQNTLNWFVLSALHFGIDVAAITTVVFDSEENLDQLFPPIKVKDIIKIPLELPASTKPRGETPTELCSQAPRLEKSGTNHLRLVGSDEGEEAARWPSDCSPFTEFLRTFPFFTRPYFEWDAFTVTIYFGRVPSLKNRTLFVS